uniref:Large ribosomal subunit protein bL28c n=1 Tax=Synarthrophyton chejuense TaxID=2485825 RepID=A0A3G3MFJ6_9FLOR|nr:ribosomal protein L28 [Synarthrophyton chejuense]AYR05596.1 ribosomal protein L28 [Synarthrophyton chejuense]
MSKKCQITNKKANNACAISHSHIRTKKLQNINLQNKRIWSKKKLRWIKLRISTKAIKNMSKIKI